VDAAADTGTVAADVPEPAPSDAPPAETADEAKPARAPRKRKAKAEAAPAEAADIATAADDASAPPRADNDGADEDQGEPRRGWWQRTFG